MPQATQGVLIDASGWAGQKVPDFSHERYAMLGTDPKPGRTVSEQQQIDDARAARAMQVSLNEIKAAAERRRT